MREFETRISINNIGFIPESIKIQKWNTKCIMMAWYQRWNWATVWSSNFIRLNDEDDYEFLERCFEIFLLWILLVRRFVRFSHSGLVQLECVYWWCRLGLGMVGLNYSFYIKIISCILYFWFYDFFAEMVGDAKFYFLFISTFNFLKFISVSRREFIRWTAVELYDDATDLQNSCDPNGFGVVCRVFVRILMF